MKCYFTCQNDHIIMYDIPIGESIESFEGKTPCKECGAKIYYQVEL